MDKAMIGVLKQFLYEVPRDWSEALSSVPIIFYDHQKSPLGQFNEAEYVDVIFSVVSPSQLYAPFGRVAVLSLDEFTGQLEGKKRLSIVVNTDYDDPPDGIPVHVFEQFYFAPGKGVRLGTRFLVGAKQLHERRLALDINDILIDDDWTRCDTATREAMIQEGYGSSLGTCLVRFLEAIACFSLPVGYRCKLTVAGKLRGPTRRLRDFSIYRCLTPNRVYTTKRRQLQDLLPTETLVSPHRRRGHKRRHWASVGINRSELSQDVMERHRIAAQKNVPWSWIPETWVGPRVFREDSVRYEIMESLHPNAHRTFDARLVDIDREIVSRSLSMETCIAEV